MDFGLCLDLLRHVFGSHVGLEHYEIANQRHDYVVLLADLSHSSKRVVIKLAGPDAPYSCPFDRTAALHSLVRAQTTVPVPEVIAVDTTYRLWPWRYIIKEYAPGVEWATALPQMDSHQKERAYRQIGHTIAELHTISFNTFGELGDDALLHAPMSYLEALTKRARQRIKDPRKATTFIKLLQDRASLFEEINQPTLCHDDLHKHNILFHREAEEWKLSAILDFDSAYAGHHEFDLSRLDLWRGMIGPGFWEAYTEVLPISPTYKERRPIHQLLWCLEYADATPKHTEDARRIYAQLNLNPE